MKKLIAKTRKQLEALLPNYFTRWDQYAATQQYEDQVALHIHDFQHYIQYHDKQRPCRDHRGTEFPCGCSPLRQDCRDILRLRDIETARGLDLRATEKLVSSYNFHRAANDLQKPVVDRLVAAPASKRMTIIADWKELVTLPLQGIASGEAFYGSARKELSVFGAIVSEHTPASTAASPRYVRTHLLILSDILDHTAARANQLLGEALKHRRFPSLELEGIDFVTDCAGHFRSYESIEFLLLQLVKQLSLEVSINYGVEKHLKHEVDRMFGWYNAATQHFLDTKCEIKEIEELQAALQNYFNEKRAKDPSAPLLKVLIESSAAVPNECRKLKLEDFRISRTYCMSSRPNKYSHWGVSLRNHVFSNRQVSMPVTICSVETFPGPEAWRRGYYGPGQNQWDVNPKPLAPDEENLGEFFFVHCQGLARDELSMLPLPHGTCHVCCAEFVPWSLGTALVKGRIGSECCVEMCAVEPGCWPKLPEVPGNSQWQSRV